MSREAPITRLLREWQAGDNAALETADRCFAVMVAANGEEHSMTSDALFTRGRVQLRRGDTSAARSDLERALDIRERMLGEEHRACQSTLLLLAAADLRDGRYADAEERSQRVLRLVERAAPEDEGRMTRALTMLRDVLAARDAEGDAERLREIEARLARLGG